MPVLRFDYIELLMDQLRSDCKWIDVHGGDPVGNAHGGTNNGDGFAYNLRKCIANTSITNIFNQETLKKIIRDLDKPTYNSNTNDRAICRLIHYGSENGIYLRCELSDNPNEHLFQEVKESDAWKFLNIAEGNFNL